MRKISLYFISRCKETDSYEEFVQNICTVVSDKKQVSEYILNSVVNKYNEHYISWLKAHGLINNDKSKRMYVDLLLKDGVRELDNFCVRKQIYDPNSVAEAFRIYMKCAPIGCSYESEEELNYYLRFTQELVKNTVEKMKTEIDKLSKKSVDSNN